MVALALVGLLLCSSLASILPGSDNAGGRPGAVNVSSPLERNEEMYTVQTGSSVTLADVKDDYNLNYYLVGIGASPPEGGMGYLVTIDYTVHEGHVWDYVWADVDVEEGSVTLEVRNADNGTYPDGPVLKNSFVLAGSESIHVDLRGLDPTAVSLEFSFILDHRGRTGTPPLLKEWRVGESDPDLWQDPMLDIERESSKGHLDLGNGSAYPDQTHIPGGLLGDYYNSLGFVNHAYTRLDQTIDFDWGNGGPGGGMGGNTFSIRWQGKILISEDDTYTFFLLIDDGGRLWIDGDLIIDEWRDQVREFSAQKTLTRGLYDIRIDHYENGGAAQCRFRWSSTIFSKEVVPHTALWGRKATNELVSEDIQPPEGQTWDLLFVETQAGALRMTYDIIDAINDKPVIGYTGLAFDVMDVSKLSVGTYPKLRLRATWEEGDITDTTVLLWWGIKWMPERTWRCEFLTDLKVVGTVGLHRWDGYIAQPGTDNQTSIFALAESFEGGTHLIESSIYKGNRWTDSVPTSNASDVAMGDLDGDGVDDLLYTSGFVGSNATAFRGTAGGYGSAPTWTFATHPDDGATSYLSHVVIEDMEGDGDNDVLFVSTNVSQPAPITPNRLLVYYNDGSKFNTTPDHSVMAGRAPVSSIDAGDIDGDGMADIAIGHDGEDGFVGVLYGNDGWTTFGDNRWVGEPVYCVRIGGVDADRFEDLFVGANLSARLLPNNALWYGGLSGIRTDPDVVFQTLPARSATYLDYNGDERTDIAYTTEDRIEFWYMGTTSFTRGSQYYVTNIIDITTINVGGDDDEDIAFTTDLPSYLPGSGYVDVRGSWSFRSRSFGSDNATAVASGSHYGQTFGSFRTSIIDVGDIDEVGSWGWVSYRAPPATMDDYDITLRILDAGSEELLWTTKGHPADPTFNISSISIEDHPKVVIEVLMENRDPNKSLPFGNLKINWTQRRPIPPEILSLEVANQTIYRTNGTVLRFRVSDDRDLPGDMTLTVQMRPPNGGGWISDRMGDPVWDGENWTVTFQTTRDDPAGDYSFRGYVTDSDMLASVTIEALDLVTVINNPPEVPSIEITPVGPTTNDDLLCVITRQAYDKDTSHLDYEYVWHLDGEEVTDLDTNSVPSNRTEKDQEWMVRVRAWDGEDHGPIVEATIDVLNSPPQLLKEMSPLMLLEDDLPYIFRLAEHFVDADNDAMTIEHSEPAAVSIEIDLQAGTLTVILPQDWHGTDEITLNVSDGDMVLQEVLKVIVEPINDPPVVVTIGGNGPVDGRFHVTAMQSRQSVFLTVVTDVDSNGFRFRSETKFASFEVVTGNGTMMIFPTNAEVGEWTINLSVEDSEGTSVVVPVDITVTNLNDRPGIVYINRPKSGMVFEHDATILFQGTCEDPDERHGQVLTFQWVSDIDGPLERGRNVQIGPLTPGDHTISLEVSDGQYVNDATIRIRIKEAPVEPPNGNGGGDDPDDDPFVPSSGDDGLMWIIMAALLVVVAGLLVLTRRKMVQRHADAKKVEDSPEDEDIHMVEGIPMAMLGDEVTPGKGTETGTDMMSQVLGRTAGPRDGDEGLRVSPWSEADLEVARRPMPAHEPPLEAPAPPMPAVVIPSEWEETPESPVTSPRPPVTMTRPPPPPPPPPVTVVPASAPTPPPMGIPQAPKPPPKKRPPEESDWEEV
jgi:hypothetical protein